MGTEAEDALRERRQKQAVQTGLRLAALAMKKERRKQQFLAARKEASTSKHSTANATSIFVPTKHQSPFAVLKSLEDKGRAKQRLAGGYVAGDLSELRKVILLCPMCKHGFDWKKHHYYNVSHYDAVRATGRCDVCRDYSQQMTLYLHETSVGLHASASWIPRDTWRQQRRLAVRTS